MIPFQTPWLRRILRGGRVFAVIIATLVLAVLTHNWCYLFHPRNATEVRDPVGNSNRALTEVGGFMDLSVDLYASDWPWTFAKPARLGDLYWPEVQNSSGAFWSGDGSILAFQTHRHENALPLFCSAYDYQKHEFIKPDYRAEAPDECDLRIRSLLKKRGGAWQLENRLGDFKSVPTVVFPAWGWIAPAAILAAVLMIMWRFRRK